MSEIYGVENLKLCKKCGYKKKREQFRKQTAAKDGLFPACIPCHNEMSKQIYKNNKEHCIKLIREWQAKNPKRLKQHRANAQLKKKEKLANGNDQ